MATMACHSDLHFEFYKDKGVKFAKKLPNQEVDVLILAGDITTIKTGYEAIKILADRFPQVLWVLGNHDHWYTSLEEVTSKILGLGLSNLNLLQNSSIELHGETFHGTTLWVGETPGFFHLEQHMRDFQLVKGGRQFIYDQNALATRYIDEHVKEGDIMITHHLPSFELISDKWSRDEMNIFYANKMDHILEKTSPKYWFHGHSHESVDRTIGKTRFIRNPYGYDYVEPNFYWNANLAFTIE